MSLDGFTLSNASRHTVKKIQDHPKLEFHAKVDLKKGVVYDHIQEAKYRDLHLTLVLPPFGHKVTIRGNFYQYLHGVPNTGDFSFPEFLHCVDLLCEEFHLKAEETKVIKVEIGVNIRTVVHPRDAIDNVIAYKGKQKDLNTFKGQGYAGTFDFQEYLVRLYCKSCKNKLSHEVLRVELATQKSNYLRRFGIRHLSDLKKVDNLVKLGLQLLQHANDFIYDDLSLDLTRLTKDEVKVVQEYRSPLAWRELMEISPDNYRKKKRRHREIIEKHCRVNWRLWLEEQLTFSMERQLGVSLQASMQMDKAA